jgi:peptidoglycan/LPS O-acetylase OafA/YrhL
MSIQSPKNTDIEVLRAIAVIMVLIDHIEILIKWPTSIVRYVHHVTSLWGGVDLFFAISGFVITSMMMRIPREEHFAAFAFPFWVKRVYRLWPSALLWVTAVLLASLFFNSSGAFGKPDGNFFDLVSVVVQMANLHWYHCFSGGGNCGVNTVYWSLSLEEQFYFVFPFLFFFLPRRALRYLMAAIVLTHFFLLRPPNSLLWEIRVDALAWGALIALCVDGLSHRMIEPRALDKPYLGFICILAIAAVIASLGTNQVVWFQVGPIALLSGTAVWIASYDKNYVLPLGRLKDAMMWIGARSYTIYLVHPFSFMLTRELFHRAYPDQVFTDRYLPAFLTVAVFLTLTLVEGSYRYLEIPLRRKGRLVAARMLPS